MRGRAKKKLHRKRVREDDSLRPESGVYFVQAETGGPIKIGRAKHVPSRIARLQVGCPFRLVVCQVFAATARVAKRTERRLHRLLGEWRLHGEWFQAHPAALQLVNREIGVDLTHVRPDNRSRRRDNR